MKPLEWCLYIYSVLSPDTPRPIVHFRVFYQSQISRDEILFFWFFRVLLLVELLQQRTHQIWSMSDDCIFYSFWLSCFVKAKDRHHQRPRLFGHTPGSENNNFEKVEFLSRDFQNNLYNWRCFIWQVKFWICNIKSNWWTSNSRKWLLLKKCHPKCYGSSKNQTCNENISKTKKIYMWFLSKNSRIQGFKCNISTSPNYKKRKNGTIDRGEDFFFEKH